MSKKPLKLTYVIILLYIFHFQLRIFGFHKLYRRYNARYSHMRTIAPADFDTMLQARDILHLIDKACTICFFSAECLHRSFIGYRLLRRRLGLPAELVIGVKKFPFTAHAWLVLDSENLNETRAFTERLQVILFSGSKVGRDS